MLRSMSRASSVLPLLRRGVATSSGGAVFAGAGNISGASHQRFRPRRALLYMPGSSPKMLAKAVALDGQVDCVCMDLEDAVALDAKPEARKHIVTALNTWGSSSSAAASPAQAQVASRGSDTERLVRINPVGSGLELADLETILSASTVSLPDGIVVPKVESAEQLRWVDTQMTRLLAGREQPSAPLILIALVESVQGVVNVASIASAVPQRLRGLIFGADDYRASVGAVKSSSNDEVSFARNLVLLHAKANGLDAIDLVQTNFADTEVVRREAMQGAALGYTGKQIIHPKQIEPVQAAFAPDDALVAWAQRVQDEADKQEKQGAQGRGAFVVDGQMVDRPLIVKAKQIIEKAKRCGKLPKDS